MASHWIITDAYLEDMLQAFIDDVHGFPNWKIDLYQNNHIPAAGDVAGDYVAANFLGYVQGTIDNTQWGTVTIVLHVAQSIQALQNLWTASPTASTQTVYGYFVTDAAHDLVYSEYFATPIIVNANDQVSIIPELRHTTYPN